jgi:hypothetical protein
MYLVEGEMVKLAMMILLMNLDICKVDDCMRFIYNSHQHVYVLHIVAA